MPVIRNSFAFHFKVAIKNINWDDLLSKTDLEIVSQSFTEKLQSIIRDSSIKMRMQVQETVSPLGEW